MIKTEIWGILALSLAFGIVVAVLFREPILAWTGVLVLVALIAAMPKKDDEG